MIGLRSIHALAVFPGDVSEETEHRDDESLEVENRRGEETWDYAVVFGGEMEHRSDGAVYRDEGEPDD